MTALQAVKDGKVDANFHFAGEFADGLNSALGKRREEPGTAVLQDEDQRL